MSMSSAERHREQARIETRARSAVKRRVRLRTLFRRHRYRGF